VQETRHFDEKTGTTSSLRTKEFAFDYRYFPEPDMVPFEPTEGAIEAIKGSLPQMPKERRLRFASEYGLSPQDIEVLTATKATGDWFEAAAAAYPGEAKKIVNWIIADLYGLLNDAGIDLNAGMIQPPQLAGLVKLVDDGAISGKQAKTVLREMFDSGDDAETVADRKGLRQESDTGALEVVVDEVIAANEDAADKVRAGNLGTLGFLVGQVMKASKGQANPGIVNELLRQKLVR
jgi:aspartyl-tRNA(Asn)/glutamyl-tRNA(Gln) amidotransferase subunit B